MLDLSAERFAQSVAIEVEGFLPTDNWFHLAPDSVKQVRLSPRAGTGPAARPTGDIRGLGLETVTAF